MSLSLAGLADIVEGAVWLPQRHDRVTDRIPLRSTVRTLVWLEKEGALGVWAELVAEHAETPAGRAKTLSDLLRGEALNKVRPECLVLPMGGIGRLKEDAFQRWKGFSYTDKPRSTLFPISKREFCQGIPTLAGEEDRYR